MVDIFFLSSPFPLYHEKGELSRFVIPLQNYQQFVSQATFSQHASTYFDLVCSFVSRMSSAIPQRACLNLLCRVHTSRLWPSFFLIVDRSPRSGAKRDLRGRCCLVDDWELSSRLNTWTGRGGRAMQQATAHECRQSSSVIRSSSVNLSIRLYQNMLTFSI